MKLYYYLEESKLCGPVHEEELRWKGLTKETLVWTKGMDDWKHIGNIPEIAESVPAHKPVVVEIKPAGLKIIISQWIAGTYREMSRLPGRLRHQNFSSLPYLPLMVKHSLARILARLAGFTRRSTLHKGRYLRHSEEGHSRVVISNNSQES